jgi:hypothetical protein
MANDASSGNKQPGGIDMQGCNNELRHFGVKGMRWGHHKKQVTDALSKTSTKIERKAYAVGAKLNPRELKYKVRKMMNKVDDDVKLLSDLTINRVKQTGVLPANSNALKAVESVGITSHKNTVYDNLNDKDLQNLKTYTDSARYSRSVNSYLAIGEPKEYAKEAEKLKNTLRKNSVDNQVVYRSCNMKFSMNGIAKKLDTMSDDEKEQMFSQLSRNFSGKSNKENRVFSTSTSPLFAIDTWRAVNPTAASTYNTYMIINCKGTPGVLADGQTSDGKALVNTKSNQEAILAPNKLTYRKLEFDKERNMFAITVDAT